MFGIEIEAARAMANSFTQVLVDRMKAGLVPPSTDSHESVETPARVPIGNSNPAAPGADNVVSFERTTQ
jgi:hypothetical protein